MKILIVLVYCCLFTSCTLFLNRFERSVKGTYVSDMSIDPLKQFYRDTLLLKANKTFVLAQYSSFIGEFPFAYYKGKYHVTNDSLVLKSNENNLDTIIYLWNADKSANCTNHKFITEENVSYFQVSRKVFKLNELLILKE